MTRDEIKKEIARLYNNIDCINMGTDFCTFEQNQSKWRMYAQIEDLKKRLEEASE